MNNKSLKQARDEDVRNISAALERAARRARELAARTHTALVTMRDGKLVTEYPSPQHAMQEEK